MKGRAAIIKRKFLIYRLLCCTEFSEFTIIYRPLNNRVVLKKYHDTNEYDGIFDEILKNSIVRYRYKALCEPYTYEVDIYQCEKSLMVICVNFKNLEESRNFQKPSWFGKEITDIEDFNRKEFFIID
ncbi:hypothetical protein [Serpentinicella alkaliphila]|uniref:Uncharacterized protein n=1 Tax=Serpentinicella alkaliphila TaxID=1734049 RepID=A0A4R2TCL7_9FIRM|nr:hypothetical protein [Serpentinicella alkaliphila]QUH24772.1 hypothetical protein HZR23_02480 [Serpentinicella alkaliphila]TCP94838.1 hypothetical protein EDD79_10707 [Serpentinicella alkaliphila]